MLWSCIHGKADLPSSSLAKGLQSGGVDCKPLVSKDDSESQI